MSHSSFADLGVSESVVRALTQRGITEPFAVQSLVTRDVLAGHDVLVQSPTGSGKTFAFGIPIVDLLKSEAQRPSALILAPTRELASQIVDELESIAGARGLRISAVYGGVGYGPQIKRAARSHILVATPGRLEDLIERGAVNLKGVEILVLDEADRMLDMGFKPAVDRIVSKTKRDRQTLFFSATLEGATGKLAAAYTSQPRRHTQEAKPADKANTTHRFVHVDSQGAKLNELIGHLRAADDGRSLVFVRTKRGADRLVQRLSKQDVRALAIHGNKSQPQREKALARFERGEVGTLVATDVAARGIDVADVVQVINFDLPEDQDTYTHRVGRTGRAGAEGSGISYVLADQTQEMRSIAKGLGLMREFEGAGKRNGNSKSQNGHSNGNSHGNGRSGNSNRRRR